MGLKQAQQSPVRFEVAQGATLAAVSAELARLDTTRAWIGPLGDEKRLPMVPAAVTKHVSNRCGP